MSMRMSSSLLIALIGSLTASVAQAYDVQCRGYDSAGGFIQGQCEGGMFWGYDSTGAMIEGSCTPGGPFTAYNNQTGAMIYGSCDSDQNR